MSNNIEAQKTAAATALQQQSMNDGTDFGKNIKLVRGRAISQLQQQSQQQQQQQQGQFQQQQQQGRKCARCGAAFGRFYNTGAPCPRCKHRVCRQCRELRSNNPNAANDWLCSVCHRIEDLRSVSAEWRRSTGRDNYLSALDILKYSIRRAWTINGPPARWSAARKSAEFRLYRSLPNRRRDYLDAENIKNAKKTPESFIKPPKIITKVAKPNESTTKKSSIPVFRNRSSKEFEDIRSPHESPKRSLIPQRYRGSTDDLRRSREDISIPSFIPKLLSPRNKEDKLKRQDSKDDIRSPSLGLTATAKFQPHQQQQQNLLEAKPTPTLRIFRRDNKKSSTEETNIDNSSIDTGSISSFICGEAPRQECSSTGQTEIGPNKGEPLKMVNELNLHATEEKIDENSKKIETHDETDDAKQSFMSDSSFVSNESKVYDKTEEGSQIADDANTMFIKETDKQKVSESVLNKKIDESQVVKRKFSKEELSNDDTDDAHNRRSSSHLSPEASPLSTRSSRYSPRESESEPTPALPRKTAIERGESSSASQRIRDAITRTRRESNSSAKYESSGSEGVRLGDSGISSYVDIARRVKLFGSGSIGPSTGSCDEILHRDSATSAGEDDHDDHSRDPTRMGPGSQNRVMLRRRRQFDAQGPRRRGRSHARSCCGAEELQALQVVGCAHSEEEAAAAAAAAAGTTLLDYRRLVFISSDSSSGREEDDADSSCSGSSYLNQPPGSSSGGSASGSQQNAPGLEDCDWDYFESNSLKLPPLQALPPQQHNQQIPGRDWTCCTARPFQTNSPSGCCQACGGSRNAKVLPVPVPIPVPVPYPVPVPASLWTGEFGSLEGARAAAASSMISRDSARLEQSLPLNLRGCDPSAAAWFSWNPRFDTSSLLFSQNHIFQQPQLSSSAEILLQPEKQEEKVESDSNRDKSKDDKELENESKELPDLQAAIEENEEQKAQAQPQQQQQRMFRHLQEQDSRSSSGRSSADSSDLEDSASHRFSRVLIVNDDSLTSDNDIEDNEDSDSAREGHPVSLRRVGSLADQGQHKDTLHEEEPVVLRRIRQLDEDADLDEDKSDKSLQLEEENEQVNERKSKNKYTLNCDDNQQEIASYDEIYLASNQENSENLVLLKSIRSIDPEGTDESIYRTDKNFTPGYKAFPKKQEQSEEEELVLENLCESEKDDSSNDSAVMPDSLEVSMQDLEDSIEVAGSTTCDAERALLAASSPIEGKSVKQEEEGLEEEDEEREGKRNPSSSSPSSSESSTSAGAAGTLSSSDELHEYSLTPCASEKKQQQDVSNISDSAALMAKSRKKWQIPTSFDIKGIPSTHFMPPERKKDTSHSSLNPLLSAAVEAADELQPEDEENANGCSPVRDDDEEDESLSLAGSMTIDENAHDESNDDDGGGGGGGSSANSERVRGNGREFEPPTLFYEQVGGSAEDSRYRAVERRTPTRKEELFDEDDVVVSPSSKRRRDWVAADVNLSLNHLNNNNINNNNAAANQVNNKYRSLVMITQGAYQPVNVITSDTTTLLQPQLEQRGYFQLAQDANQETTRRSALQGLTKKPLPCKRLLTNPEPEVDSGLSVGSASESDDVQSVKNASKQNSRSPILLSNREEDMALPLTPPQEYEQAKRSGPLILEEGLADDDSWVEEISHDEDEQSATTATEESSEDEAGNNLGDREEELRGYHRQAIDFTLHTIVEESCEESESEHVSASWRRRLVSASAPDLDKYLFFGLGPDGGGNSSREMDSLSETSSIFSEGLDSLAREESAQSSNQEKKNAEYSNGNSSRMEKYFLAEFLGLDQDRRDSDGSVGSDSEGRPSPEAQRRKRLVRPRGTGRSHSSSLDNLLALAHSSQNSGSYQNSLQDGSPGTDGQELQSEGSSTETDGADENPAPAFGTDGQFDTVKRRKKKLRNPGAQSPRVSEDRNKTPEPRDAVLASVELPEEEADIAANSEEDGAKTPQPEIILANSPAEGVQNVQDEVNSARSKQQSRDSGFVGSCDDLLLTPQRNAASEGKTSPDNSSASGDAAQTKDYQQRDKGRNDRLLSDDRNIHERILESQRFRERFAKIDVHKEQTTGGSLSRKDSFNNWSSDEETNLMMSKMRQFFKTMVANSNNTNQTGSTASSAASPVPSPSPRLSGYSSKTRNYTQTQNRTKPPQLVYFENELTRLMKTVPGIRDEQVREIVEYLSSEDTWSDSYDSSDYTSSDLEGATAGGRRSALQEQISQSCQQIISKFDTNAPVAQEERASSVERKDTPIKPNTQQALGRDTAFVYQKLVQSFTKMAGDNVTSDTSSTPHSSPPLIAKVMHHIGSRLVALMHEVSESNSTGGHSHTSDRWRRYPHHRTPSSASTTEDDDSTSDSASAPTHLPRSKSHDPLLLINGHASATSMPPEAEEREASDYERFSWRGSFESALMAADSRTKLSLLACSGDMSATAMAAKRRSAGDLLFNPKSFSREQLDRVRSCGSIGGTVGAGTATACGGSIEEKIWSNRRRSSVPDANTRGESGASAGDEDTEDEEDEDLDYAGDSRATTLPRGMQVASNAATSATNSLPRQSGSSANMHKAHSVYHFLPQHSAVKSARYRPPGFTRNSPSSLQSGGPKRAFSAPGLQLQSRSRRAGQQSIAHGQNNTNASSANVSANASADEASLSEACSTPIIGASSRTSSSHTSIDLDDLDRSLHSTHLATRASLSSLGARSDSMASVYSGAGEGRWCGSVAVRGEVEFSLQYDYKQLTFEVHVTQCRDLAPVDVKRNRSDPYVKVYLLPDKSKSGKRKTKVKKHTLNPVFDETLKFHTNINSLESRTLWLTVWHSDMFGRNDFLGEVRMPLENKIFDDPRPQWYPLQERTEPFDDPVAYKGEVIVGLKFVPPDPSRQDRDRETNEQRTNKLKKNWSRGSLHVLVKEARNLQTRAKNSGTCDPFCKSYLLPDKGRSGKQKTGVVRRSTGSPVWNHTFVYKDVSLQELAERGLELTVWDHDRIASNEFLGGVRFNLGTGKHYGKAVDWMDATGREMSLWQSMLERPNFWVEGVVTLRPNLHNHGKTGPS